MRRYLITAIAANICLLTYSFAVLPDRVAMQFGSGGVPNSWGSKWAFVAVFAVADLIVAAIAFLSVPACFKLPASLLSLPNKDYWLKPENRKELEARFSALIEEFGVALFAFLFLVGLLTLDANLSDPVRLNESLLLMFFAAFMLYVLYWLIKLLRRMKVPRQVSN